MGNIRILIVDDSAVVRRFLARLVAEDPELELAGTAASGRLALAKLPIVEPQIVLLDIRMPGMDGLETLTEIKKEYPAIKVIMFSSLTERGAAETLDALAKGAADYVTKPKDVAGFEDAKSELRETLITKIKAIAKLPRKRVSDSSRIMLKPASSVRLTPATNLVRIVAIGTSTGGPNALATLVKSLPDTLSVPILIVQHMPPIFTKLLADRLNGLTELSVKEAMHGVVIKPGEIWIAPGDRHMVVRRQDQSTYLELTRDPPENSCRPSVDVLVRSVIEVYGHQSLAVILTGMGKDGFKECQELRRVGGHVIAQDEESSVVWGMPGYVARGGVAQNCFSIDTIGYEITRLVSLGRVTRVSPESTNRSGSERGGKACP
ncbi:MAG: chemotaxis response regulator protein-glutamate methylesterase [Planctomycetota bacterium]|nr:chemotaxis response regulator protein-glutamate methylesterase [Planctomycetota bacterium]